VLLVFARMPDEIHFYPGDPDLREAVLRHIAEEWGVSLDQLQTHPALNRAGSFDSLDLVEAVMEWEDEHRTS
jgi:acyl carrier protein